MEKAELEAEIKRYSKLIKTCESSDSDEFEKVAFTWLILKEKYDRLYK